MFVLFYMGLNHFFWNGQKLQSLEVHVMAFLIWSLVKRASEMGYPGQKFE